MSTLLATVGSVGLGATPAMAATAATQSAPTVCTAAYTVTGSWVGRHPGFTAQLRVANVGLPTLQGWSVVFTLPTSTQTVQKLWGGTAQQAGGKVTVSPASYDGTLYAHRALTLGYLGTGSGLSAIPSSVTLNGSNCPVTVHWKGLQSPAAILEGALHAQAAAGAVWGTTLTDLQHRIDQMKVDESKPRSQAQEKAHLASFITTLQAKKAKKEASPDALASLIALAQALYASL
ncbi:cellulose binding domain-containing protein [Motilibacter rhizosphaerae]|uniref:cellulose binding domain-containing protein n=1 Tax=Motilibacter rhizosphaerae TaxID=598652 RepID=UPI0013EE7909|nr:cellulose binding domain-containing protein [Motilibacter rhizosphaerae]